MLKKRMHGFQKRVGKFFAVIPVHPNSITLLSVLFAIIGSYLFFRESVAALVFFLFAFLFDGLDGAIAREKKLTSAYGAYLDGVSDRLVEFFVLLPFIFINDYFIPALVILFFGTAMHSFCKAYADHRGVLDSKKAAGIKSIFPRTERVIMIFLAVAFILVGIKEGLYVLWAGAIFSVVAFIILQYNIYKLRK